MIKKKDPNFQTAITISVILHLIVIAVFLFGLPTIFEHFPEEKDVMTFEVLPMSAITNVKTESKVEKKPEESKQLKLNKKPKPKPKAQPKPKPKPKEKPAPPKKKVTQPKPKPPAPKAQPKPKPKPPVKKEEDPIDSILKDLEKTSEGDKKNPRIKNTKELPKGSKSLRGMEYDENSPLSITEKLFVKSKIEKNWRPPVGANNLKDVRVLLHMTLEKTGAVKRVTIKKMLCPDNSELTCKLTAESAIRAVRAASPFKQLLPERYDTWKEFDLNFDPSFLAQ